MSQISGGLLYHIGGDALLSGYSYAFTHVSPFAGYKEYFHVHG